ncbi:MAG TPA: hypothetical protein VG253_06145 [Streptosporangiaceae bacterium]|nr:hypothetical protein [Streptosporangiaceae bacterium]
MIEVGIVTDDWLLTGHIEVSICTEPGCPDWHTITICHDDKEVLTVALSPGQDRELATRLTARADSVTTIPQKPGGPRRPLTVSPRTPVR